MAGYAKWCVLRLMFHSLGREIPPGSSTGAMRSVSYSQPVTL